ncbi:hypothetical protein [Micromonospora sp. WMMD1082]|uniref:hypothetical protein n=1 Tax=Micromonospora sp. WMMD1082 TaxID=3016104 RepID=UPI002417F541|nr:hypothetical protein [Micromonospora sp. WMMD1082]MDG4795051.1 hypothetical protein [Micromonospora sp. WMMD1082]
MTSDKTHDNTSDHTDEAELAVGQIVTVTTSDDVAAELGNYLHIVTDVFGDPVIAIARMGGEDGFGWTVPRDRLHRVAPERLIRVIAADGGTAYIAG